MPRQAPEAGWPGPSRTARLRPGALSVQEAYEQARASHELGDLIHDWASPAGVQGQPAILLTRLVYNPRVALPGASFLDLADGGLGIPSWRANSTQAAPAPQCHMSHKLRAHRRRILKAIDLKSGITLRKSTVVLALKPKGNTHDMSPPAM